MGDGVNVFAYRHQVQPSPANQRWGCDATRNLSWTISKERGAPPCLFALVKYAVHHELPVATKPWWQCRFHVRWAAVQPEITHVAKKGIGQHPTPLPSQQIRRHFQQRPPRRPRSWCVGRINHWSRFWEQKDGGEHLPSHSNKNLGSACRCEELDDQGEDGGYRNHGKKFVPCAWDGIENQGRSNQQHGRENRCKPVAQGDQVGFDEVILCFAVLDLVFDLPQKLFHG